jgi:hypothetical protein
MGSRDKHVVLLNDLSCLPPAQQKQIKVLEKTVVQSIAAVLAQLRPDLEPPLQTALTMYLLGAINWTYTWFDAKGTLTEHEFADLATTTFLSGIAGPLSIKTVSERI